jgi:hypothetical protein
VHNLALLTLPVYISVLIVLVARKRLPAWTFVALAGGYIAGASLYIAVIVDFAVKSGDISGAFLSALFGRYSSQVLSTTINWHFIKANAGLASLNFVNFSLPLAVIGWVRMKSRLGGLLAAALLAITVIEFVFFVRYPVPDQFTFFLPSLVMISVGACIGISVLADISKKWRYAVIMACTASIIIPPVVYANGPEIIRMLGIEIKRERTRPFRDENRYWLIPWKHNERSAEQFAEAALKQAFPDGIIACDGTSYYPLLLVQRRDNLAPEVSIQRSLKIKPQAEKDETSISNILRERPLFVVLPVLNFLPPDVMANVDISRKNGDVLYSVRWTGN